eukprot:TRINITY_DN8808_c0_g1_i10.p1 TRINITY_DN8808_c0_g1~~TRINITY_DN8808_c0_g1_i10.p1  ORF type:complete len:391 (-),score=49.95 TRINITY_DN8808_c0_g1_i10:350-1522(-)
METNRVVVVDNGSYTIKAGFAGDDLPREVIRSVVGHPRRRGIIGQPFRGELIKENYYGTEALSRRGILTHKYPIERGIITNWDEMELVWENIYSTALSVDPKEHAVIHTESTHTDYSPQHRTKLIQIHFETFGVPALFVGVDAFLSLYASGRQTGVVVQSGYEMTCSIPIIEGKIFGTHTLDIGGRDITDYMMTILTDRGYSFTSTTEGREIVNKCKEKCCFVSLDFESDMYKASREPDYLLAEHQLEGNDSDPVLFQNERFRSPEILFQPSFIGMESSGIPEMVYNSIMKIEQQRRNDMWKNIVLAGGSTFFELIEEQTAQPPFYDKVHAMAEGNTESATNNRFCSLPSELVGVILNYSQVKVRTELASLRTRLHKDLLSFFPATHILM